MPDGWTLVKPTTAAAPAADSGGWAMVTPAAQRKPAAAEDFMRPEDIANRDNGTPLALDVLKGFGKRAVSSAVDFGQMASTGIAESAARAAASAVGAPFNPVISDPIFARIKEATAQRNKAQELGGNLELVAELAPGAIGLAKAVPSLARGAVSLAKSGGKALAEGLAKDTPLLTQARQAAARKVLGNILDSAKKAPVAAAEPPAVMTSTAATAPQTISAPGGFSMPVRVPQRPVAPPPGRLVPAPPSVEEAVAQAMGDAAEARPMPLVTTPPPADLPPGYTPRSTVPKPKPVKMAAKAEPKPPAERKRAYFLRSPDELAEAAPIKATPAGQQRPYFLKSPEEIAAAQAPAEAVTPSGSITMDDLPASWRSHTGQDLFPTTGVEAKVIREALRAEIQDRGLTVGQAMAAISKNKDIPTKFRSQMMRALSGGK